MSETKIKNQNPGMTNKSHSEEAKIRISNSQSRKGKYECSNDQIQEIKKLYEQGISLNAIGRLFNVSHQIVDKYIKLPNI